MTETGPHFCPACGERVSAFAAGCAYCGAPLDPHRADVRPTAFERFLRELERFLRGDNRPRGHGGQTG